MQQQQFALLNMENYLAEMRSRQQSVVVKVVLEGEGVLLLARALEQPQLQQRIRGLQRYGVQFVLGRASVRQQRLVLQRDLLLSSTDQIVENAILELARLQQQGFAYIPYHPE